jgi:hypothetical protein
VSPPGHEKQVPESIKKRFGPASFANETLPLRTQDLPLRGILVTIVEECSEIRPQINLMKTIALFTAAKAGRSREGLRCADFDVT